MYFRQVGEKYYRTVPFLGMHQLTIPQKKKKEKKPKTNHEKKPINNRSLCCCVTFHVTWKYFFQNLEACCKNIQKHTGIFLSPFQSKAKFHPCSLSLFFLLSLKGKKKKKSFENFIFSIHCSPGQSKALFYIDVKIFTKIRVSFLYCSN